MIDAIAFQTKLLWRLTPHRWIAARAGDMARVYAVGARKKWMCLGEPRSSDCSKEIRSLIDASGAAHQVKRDVVASAGAIPCTTRSVSSVGLKVTDVIGETAPGTKEQSMASAKHHTPAGRRWNTNDPAKRDYM